MRGTPLHRSKANTARRLGSRKVAPFPLNANRPPCRQSPQPSSAAVVTRFNLSICVQPAYCRLDSSGCRRLASWLRGIWRPLARWHPRAGNLVPKLRRGTYFPERLLENRRRAEKALTGVIAECYVRGVSTRRVDGLVKTLGIEGISSSQVSRMAKSLDEEVEAFRSRPLDGGAYPYLWLDALVMRVRELGRVVKVTVMVASAVNAEGHREILGLETATEETGAAWTAFLRELVARGLCGVPLVVSDHHEGLMAAIGAAIPGYVLAAVPHALHAQPAVQGAEDRAAPRGHTRALDLRPALAGGSRSPARPRHRTALREVL